MPSVLALFAHPDDIEFRAAGTLLMLGRHGWDIHYCNLANGNLGSAVLSLEETEALRARESRTAAALLEAEWHPSFCGDLQVFYEDAMIRRVCALVREVRPSILLTHPFEDYMEDHMNTARLAVSGAFARGIPNYRSIPERAPVLDGLTVYHSMPHGLRGRLRERVEPEAFVDVSGVYDLKRGALACHQSQKDWLDLTQGPGSYLNALDREARELAGRARTGVYAEGWTRHLHLGFGAAEDNPMRDALGEAYVFNPDFTVCAV